MYRTERWTDQLFYQRKALNFPECLFSLKIKSLQFFFSFVSSTELSFYSESASGQCCWRPFEDHRVGFSSKPDRFFFVVVVLGVAGGLGLGSEGCGWVRVRVVGGERVCQVSLQFKYVCPYSAYSLCHVRFKQSLI